MEAGEGEGEGEGGRSGDVAGLSTKRDTSTTCTTPELHRVVGPTRTLHQPLFTLFRYTHTRNNPRHHLLCCLPHPLRLHQPPSRHCISPTKTQLTVSSPSKNTTTVLASVPRSLPHFPPHAVQPSTIDRSSVDSGPESP